MRNILYTLGVSLVLLLGACGDIDEKNDREVVSNNEKAVQEQEDVAEEGTQEEETEERKEEKSVGTRSNPLPFGDTITVKQNIYDDSYNRYAASIEITLHDTIRGEEAWSIIQKENPYNDPAKEGFEHVLIKVKGFLKDAETDDDSLLFSSWDFDFVSDEGEVYDYASGVIPDELQKELYNGGTAEGYIHGEVKEGDDFKVSYDSTEGSPVFFFVK